MVEYFMEGEMRRHHGSGGWFAAVHRTFERGFERLRATYTGALAWALRWRSTVLLTQLAVVTVAALVLPHVGRDFFPDVDAGQIRLHVTAPTNLRIEETELLFQRVEDVIREVIPANELVQIIDNFGTFQSINLAFRDSANIGSFDGEILVSLAPERSASSAHYVRLLRERLPRDFPGVRFYTQPADIVTQILNFGLPAPINVQVTGPNRAASYQAATRIAARLASTEGIVDARVHQITDAAKLHLEVDRVRAAQRGLTQRDIASNVLLTLSGSAQVQPTFWVDAATGRNYPVTAQTPQLDVNSVQDLETTPVATPDGGQVMLTDLLEIRRGAVPVNISHANVQPSYDVFANVQGTDLGSVSSAVASIAAEERAKLPPGSAIEVRGQILSMNRAFLQLGIGVAFAALLVYLLMVVNFQSWLDPFIIITALPGAFTGIILFLFLTDTTFSVPSLMGTIMCIGVATSNSILMVTFANERRLAGDDARTAALAAGRTRLRPVLMTALAMILGMLPMSLGLGEGGEQNAPLGRAVIGGLLVATLTTLFFVPTVYSLVRRSVPRHLGAVDPELQ
jgi:multidrug efflux pump subunit AcrB